MAGAGARTPPSPARIAVRVAPHLAIALAVVALRFAILGGFGGSGDVPAPLPARAFQIGAGLATAVVGTGVLPDAAALLLGAGLLAWAAAHAGRARMPGWWLPLLWMGIAVLPLPAAGWVVGSRYFYVAAAGMASLVGAALAERARVARATLLAILVGIGGAAALQRHADVGRYAARLEAAEDAVASGLVAGHRIFRVRSGIKDLDLALKLRPRLAARAGDFLVIPDVPASFALLPAGLAPRIDFLLAHPPLPPSGAYLPGGRRIAGLARREDAPDLDEVRARLPDLRLVDLHERPDGTVTWRDVSGESR